eukprot:CAMPEP_0119347424 /NCGR_PEP_ID=MMETSP1333-20130426/108516_1 /TAXON_ID=418940 /ORGANISM="Scyphosphaera apsteinii, Strain RCC1455" /LENGTH=119 /DNA_ID=CAMNT_0007359969 /DNA_START=576 /DNA_END=934 /DNA_ORIENTATION=-
MYVASPPSISEGPSSSVPHNAPLLPSQNSSEGCLGGEGCGSSASSWALHEASTASELNKAESRHSVLLYVSPPSLRGGSLYAEVAAPANVAPAVVVPAISSILRPVSWVIITNGMADAE